MNLILYGECKEQVLETISGLDHRLRYIIISVIFLLLILYTKRLTEKLENDA